MGYDKQGLLTITWYSVSVGGGWARTCQTKELVQAYSQYTKMVQTV